jgi:hypothetical protein
VHVFADGIGPGVPVTDVMGQLQAQTAGTDVAMGSVLRRTFFAHPICLGMFVGNLSHLCTWNEHARVHCQPLCLPSPPRNMQRAALSCYVETVPRIPVV